MCELDKRLARQRREQESRLGIIRRCLINTAADAFDIHSEYPRYSLGEKEFCFERVSLLQRNQDYVMIDPSANAA